MRGNFITDRNGESNPNYKHGGKGTRLWSIYNGMKSRCYNPNVPAYKFYGGRGITICSEWLDSFPNFRDWALANGYSDDLTLDRKDTNGNYSPDNCRWSTKKEQALNTRRNHLVTIGGVTKPLSVWCELYSINYKTVRDRLKRGWDYQSAIIKPIRKTRM